MADPAQTLSAVHKELAATKRAIEAAEIAASCLEGTANEFATASGFRFSLDSVIDLLGGNQAQHQRLTAAEGRLRDAQQALADLNRALGLSRFDVTMAAVESVPQEAMVADAGDQGGWADAMVRFASADAAASSRVLLADVVHVREELMRRRSVLQAALARLDG